MRMQIDATERRVSGAETDPVAEDLARVAGWLQPQRFLIDTDARDVEQALRIAAESIGTAKGIGATLLFDALWRREQAASTALGAGFAIPHARLAGIDRPVTLFMRLRTGIPFGAADHMPVRFVLVIVVPNGGAHVDHLRMLSLIARLFSMPRFRKQIDRAPDAAEGAAIFRSAIAKAARTARSTWMFA